MALTPRGLALHTLGTARESVGVYLCTIYSGRHKTAQWGRLGLGDVRGVHIKLRGEEKEPQREGQEDARDRETPNPSSSSSPSFFLVLLKRQSSIGAFGRSRAFPESEGSTSGFCSACQLVPL